MQRRAQARIDVGRQNRRCGNLRAILRLDDGFRQDKDLAGQHLRPLERWPQNIGLAAGAGHAVAEAGQRRHPLRPRARRAGQADEVGERGAAKVLTGGEGQRLGGVVDQCARHPEDTQTQHGDKTRAQKQSAQPPRMRSPRRDQHMDLLDGGDHRLVVDLKLFVAAGCRRIARGHLAGVQPLDRGQRPMRQRAEAFRFGDHKRRVPEGDIDLTLLGAGGIPPQAGAFQPLVFSQCRHWRRDCPFASAPSLAEPAAHNNCRGRVRSTSPGSEARTSGSCRSRSWAVRGTPPSSAT